MHEFGEFGGTLGEFERRVLRPVHPGVFQAHLVGIRVRLG